jgi:hypothetical protein
MCRLPDRCHLRRALAFGRSARSSSYAAAGKYKETTVPWPGNEWISIDPPMERMTRWQNISPMPLPPEFARVVTGSWVSLAST